MNYCKIKILLCAFLSLFLFGQCYSIENVKSDFLVLTVPKSGTHLIMKMLHMLTAKTHANNYALFNPITAFNFREDDPSIHISSELVERAFLIWKRSNVFPIFHFNMAEDFHLFWLNHPNYVKIIQIRDLRDVYVSCVFHQLENIEKEIGPCTFDQKLLYLICLDNKPTKNNIIRLKKNAEIAVEWMQDPETIVCRFEHLAGEKGGGSLTAQREQIITIANSLNINLNSAQLNWITNNLFGTETGPPLLSTYREGKIGSWRNYFTDEHKRAFEEHLGEIQLNLGYGLFDDENENLAIKKE
ncbi:MAG: hypothetical protein H0V82_02430 [Candidatus Protochlamydia sp.]|nr:hypothetical protein [Candidatus Protochlamydia sp.]